jgi:deoxycytidylate deaminase
VAQRDFTFGPARYFRPVSSKGPFGHEEISEEEAVKVVAVCNNCQAALASTNDDLGHLTGGTVGETLVVTVTPCAHCLAVERELGQREKD